MSTRVSRRESDEIASMAAASYRGAALELQNWYERSGAGCSPIHAMFGGAYSASLVWGWCGRILGEQRRENLSRRNFQRLVAAAENRHEKFVRYGVCYRRGLLKTRQEEDSDS